MGEKGSQLDYVRFYCVRCARYIEALNPIVGMLNQLVDLAPDPDQELEGAYEQDGEEEEEDDA